MDDKKIVLLETCFDLSSCGIGVQRYFVESLTIGRELKDFEKRIIDGDHGTNFWIPIVTSLQREEPYDKAVEYFGLERHIELAKECKEFKKEEKRLNNVIIRSLAASHYVDKDDELIDPEYESFFKALSERYVKSDQPIPEEVREKMKSEKDIFGMFRDLCNARIFPNDKFIEDIHMYKLCSENRKRYVALHTNKLKFMLHLIEASIEATAERGIVLDPSYRPATLDSKWAENWKKCLEEEMPTIWGLLETTKETIRKAKEYINS